MSSPDRLVAAIVGVVLLLGGTACQTSTPDPQGSSMTKRDAQMPTLPDDPDAAEAAVRRMLIDEAIVLLKASGLKYSKAQFDVPTSFDDNKAQTGELAIVVNPCTEAQEQAMTAAIWAHGWEQGSISHAVNVRKGPFYLQWGNGDGGCYFEMITVNIDQYLPGIKDVTNVPELAEFKART